VHPLARETVGRGPRTATALTLSCHPGRLLAASVASLPDTRHKHASHWPTPPQPAAPGISLARSTSASNRAPSNIAPFNLHTSFTETLSTQPARFWVKTTPFECRGEASLVRILAKRIASRFSTLYQHPYRHQWVSGRTDDRQTRNQLG
jgi:hypothetical protein